MTLRSTRSLINKCIVCFVYFVFFVAAFGCNQLAETVPLGSRKAIAELKCRRSAITVSNHAQAAALPDAAVIAL